MKLKTIYARPRIDRLLNSATDYPLTAVVAGAGYGKTTAAKEYLRKSNVLHILITLTDGEGGVFWDKLCAAIDPLNKQIADELRVIGLPVETWAIFRALKLARLSCSRPFIICVDDYQNFPENSPVHKLVETIAFEVVPNLHILLLSRAQPNIRLATLVSKEMAQYIDVAALSFTAAETEGYLSMRGLRLTKDAIHAIQEVSDGWVSAIYLLGEGIRSGGNIQRSTINTLFTENLLHPLQEIDRESLYRLSVFDAFSLDLAADALGTERIREVIAALVRENAFITCDDTGWYRFHPLLHEYLTMLCPNDERQKNVCRRAGLWSVTHSYSEWLLPVTLFEKAGCIEEYLSLLNKPNAPRINYADMAAICRTVTTLPPEKCLAYPFPYLQLVFYMILSGERQPMLFAGKIHGMMRAYFTEHADAPYRDAILGELIVIARVTDFERYEGEPLYEAERLLGGRPSDILNPFDPFNFGLPMLLDSEYMRPGVLDEAVERCQHNAYELVTDGFGRGSEKLIRAEAALMRCQLDHARRFAKQAVLDAAEKHQFFIMASAYCSLMRAALFLGDIEEAFKQLSAIRALIPTASRTPNVRRFAIVMLRETLALAECFYNTALLNREDIPEGFLNGTHKSVMVAGLGIPQVYMANAMYRTGDYVGAERMCDSLSRVPNVCQNARLYGLIITSLCRERYYGAGSGLSSLQTALSEAAQDGVVLPFAEAPELLGLLGRLKRTGDLPEDFLNTVRRQCEAYAAIAPRQPAEAVLLSNREREVLRLTAAGKRRSEIAALLHVQENTVKAQLSAAYKKLGAKGKTEAVRIARMDGLI